MAEPSPIDRSAPTQPPANPVQETASSADDRTAGFPSSGGGDLDALDFLAKAEAADELGRLAHYRVLKELGRGGMGCVLLAEDTKLQRNVALKVMLPRFARDVKAKERFLREARAAAKIRHDNVITIHQVDEANGVPFIALEFLEGAPLDKFLKNKGTLALPLAVRIAREMAEGLAAAHKQGLIHRDIKPGNVWLEAPKGRVKILDFGLARAESDDTHLTQSGAIVGTPAFMAPEQGRGEKVDGRCDLFSLGVVLYRMTTGHQPFEGPTTVAMLMAIAMNTPKPARSVNAKIPESLEKIMTKLLEKDPAQRYASAKDVIMDMNGVLKEMAQATKVEAPTEAFAPLAVPDLAAKGTFEFSAVSPKVEPSSRPVKRKIPWSPLVGLLGLLFVGIICWQIVIRITDDKGNVKEIEVPKGGKVEIVEKPGPKKLPEENKPKVDPATPPTQVSSAATLQGHASVVLSVAFSGDGKRIVSGSGDKTLKVWSMATAQETAALNEKEAKTLQQDWAKKLGVAVVEKSKVVGIEMVLIPPGGEALPKAYRLGKYEVTQGEWEAVMGYNPSSFKKGNEIVEGLDTSRFPVEQVSWYDSVEYCNKLSEKEGLKHYYALAVTKRSTAKQIDEAEVKILGGSGYHIPTDAEWEHGCQAGTKTKYHCGDKDEDLLEYAWFDKNSDGRTHTVGEKKPNAFGLYDMHGNVREWNEEMLTNATSGAPERVYRGGFWYYPAGTCAVSSRNRLGPAYRSSSSGLRLARVP